MTEDGGRGPGDAGPARPRLTVLLPCWNAASTIERALESVLEEEDVPLECVVIDDASTDGTPDLVQAVAARDPRVVLVRMSSNEGVSNARNRGLAVARGDWIAFLDADDRLRPGGLAALMRPTSDPTVLAVIGQRVWTDGEQTWLAQFYDNADVREPGRKSIASHPGLLYYIAAWGKAFHQSLLTDLHFEGRILGDQPWTVRALLRAGDGIEVIGETVYEWWRPPPDRWVPTISEVARASAARAVALIEGARAAYLAVSPAIDEQLRDEPARQAFRRAYLERLLRSDVAPQVKRALERGDPDTGLLFAAVARFLATVPPSILDGSDAAETRIARYVGVRYPQLAPAARRGYWRMARLILQADSRSARRIAGRRGLGLAFSIVRATKGPLGEAVAGSILLLVDRANRVFHRSDLA